MELMHLLKIVISASSKSAVVVDPMEVDATSNGHNNGKMPQLDAFLALCIAYPTSPPALRAAMRQYLTDIEDITKLLQILDKWIGNWSCIDDFAKLQPEAKNDKQQALQFAQVCHLLRVLVGLLTTKHIGTVVPPDIG